MQSLILDGLLLVRPSIWLYLLTSTLACLPCGGLWKSSNCPRGGGLSPSGRSSLHPVEAASSSWGGGKATADPCRFHLCTFQPCPFFSQLQAKKVKECNGLKGTPTTGGEDEPGVALWDRRLRGAIPRPSCPSSERTWPPKPARPRGLQDKGRLGPSGDGRVGAAARVSSGT